MLFILAGFLVQPISIVPNKKPENKFHESKDTIWNWIWEIQRLQVSMPHLSILHEAPIASIYDFFQLFPPFHEAARVGVNTA